MARNASINAVRLAQTLSEQLAANGYVVVSGLARGIDTAAHNGALARGTVAVIAGGIDIQYPPENADLHDAIAESGLLLAEMPPAHSQHRVISLFATVSSPALRSVFL